MAPVRPDRSGVTRGLPQADAFPRLEAFVGEMGELLQGLSSARRRNAAARQQAKVVRIVIGLAMLTVFLALSGRSSPLLAVVAAALVALLVLVVGRAWVSVTTCEVSGDPVPDTAALGQTLVWGATVRAKKGLVLQPGRIVLRCQEHAIGRAGKQTTHHRHIVYEQALPTAGRSLQPGDDAEVRAEVTVPSSATPSYPGQHNRIEWTLSLEVPVEGLCRDIRHTVPLTVLPIVGAEADEAAQGTPTIPAGWLEGASKTARPGAAQDGRVSAVLWPADGNMPYAVPAVSVGSTREFRVRLETAGDIDSSGVFCTIGCRIRGRGTDEQVVVAERLLIHEGKLTAGQPVDLPLAVRAPASGPVSYNGSYINFDWSVRVAVAARMRWDEQVEVPFVVTPRLAED